MDPGEAVLLEAPSGAGKSTLLQLACGLIPRTQGGRVGGDVRLDGQPVHELAVEELAGRIGYVPQDPETAFVARTVRRELEGVLANLGVHGRERRLRIEQVLHEVGGGELADREIATLSGGEAARAAIAAALVAEPDVLVLDEPTAQLDAEGARELAGTLRALRAGGLAILVAAHRPHPLDPVATRTVELGPYGRPPTVPTLPPPRSDRLDLVLDGASCAYEEGPVVGPIDLEVRAGEVVLLQGPNGSGKTTALHLACGLRSPDEGRVQLRGGPPGELDARELARRVGVSFQHPAWHITQDDVRTELALTGRQLGVEVDAGGVLSHLGLDGLGAEHPWDLSGGERQRLAVGTALAHDPPVLLLDEPTRGLDAPGLERFARLLARRTRRHQSTLIASHHPWLARLAHRTITLEQDEPEAVPAELPEVPA